MGSFPRAHQSCTGYVASSGTDHVVPWAKRSMATLTWVARSTGAKAPVPSCGQTIAMRTSTAAGGAGAYPVGVGGWGRMVRGSAAWTQTFPVGLVMHPRALGPLV